MLNGSSRNPSSYNDEGDSSRTEFDDDDDDDDDDEDGGGDFDDGRFHWSFGCMFEYIIIYVLCSFTLCSNQLERN